MEWDEERMLEPDRVRKVSHKGHTWAGVSEPEREKTASTLLGSPCRTSESEKGVLAWYNLVWGFRLGVG